jgi:hypothetical protein
MRSAAGRSWLARSCCTDACSALNPSKPSLVARRTTVAAPEPDPSARSATVPNATSCGFASTTSATRRSAVVRVVLVLPMRSATSTAAEHSSCLLVTRSFPIGLDTEFLFHYGRTDA